MPRRDGTGPDGEGARTGRGLGPCSNNQSETNRGQGLGRGRGLRHGRNGVKKGRGRNRR